MKWYHIFVLVFLIGISVIAGTIIGIRLSGPVAYRTDLGTVEITVQPHRTGEVDIYVPLADWGVRFGVFHAPVRIHIEPRSLDREALLSLAQRPKALYEVREQVSQAAVRAVTRSLIWGAISAGILGLIVVAFAYHWHHTRRWWVSFPFVIVALIALNALLVFQLKQAHSIRWEHPTFYARGAELPQLLKLSAGLQKQGKQYRSTIQRTIENFTRLFSDPHSSARSALVVSDLHNNVLVLDPLRQYIAGGPVFFIGDFATNGNRMESRLVSQVAHLSETVVAVSGNHDSRLLMRSLARRGVVVLTRNGQLEANGRIQGPPVIQIGGFTVAGFDDPLEYTKRDPDNPKRIFSFDHMPDGRARLQKAQTELVQWFDSLPRKPDIVLVHQNALAQFLAQILSQRGYKSPLTILTGHDHKQHVDIYDTITIVDAGSVGAGGQFGIGKDFVGLAHIHFDRKRLRLVDLIQTEPISSAAEAERIVIDRPQCTSVRLRCPMEQDLQQEE